MSISFFGTTLILAALAAALLQCLLPFFGSWKKNNFLLALAAPCALIQGFLIANAFFLLILAFLTNDFSLAYVAGNSHPSLPFYYRLAAVWGAHEGSFLLWIFILDLWTAAFCFFSKKGDRVFRAVTLGILGLISCCFLLFLVCTSNPFKTAVSALPQDLNPLLQDPGFFIHPPMLYAGYVGFSVVFAMTMASLISGSFFTQKEGRNKKLPVPKGNEEIQAWARFVRPWVLAAWSFLTIGITLGSWWAYHVLGWGGFWFWDPVENASLLPWLSGAALLHLLIVVEKQQRFKNWAFFLAILCFSLSILGTFLVRSGVLISVHSFATDPSRGLFLLLLLALITGSALAIFIFHNLSSNSSLSIPIFSWSAREGILLLQSILLFTAAATVLLGTLYPLIIEASGLGSLSVGPPYFNRVLFPLLLLCLILMGWAPLSQWGESCWKKALKNYSLRHLLLSLTLAITVTLFFTGVWRFSVMLNLSLIFWVLLSLNKLVYKKMSMALAHSGFALVIMSIVLSSAFSQARELRMQPGEEVGLGPYLFQFKKVQGVEGPNFKGVRASFSVLRHHKQITQLYPEKRIYTVRNMVMSKVDIYPALFHDLYISLGEPLSEQAWSLRIYYKPFIRWVWLGGFLIALSGFLSLLRLAGSKR